MYHFLRAQVRTSQVEVQPVNESELRLRYFEIIQDLKFCAKSFPEFPYASFNIGNTYVKLKDYQSAINAYTEALERALRQRYGITRKALPIKHGN